MSDSEYDGCCFEVEEKQYEEEKLRIRRTGLIVGNYDFPDDIAAAADEIYKCMTKFKYSERINKIINIAFICFYYAAQENGYHRTPQNIALRVGFTKSGIKSDKLMPILKSFSHMYTSYRRKMTRVTCIDLLREYRGRFSAINDNYGEVETMWLQIVNKHPGIQVNSNPIFLVASLIIYYMRTIGFDGSDNVCTIFNVKKKSLNKYISAFDKIYNSS